VGKKLKKAVLALGKPNTVSRTLTRGKKRSIQYVKIRQWLQTATGHREELVGHERNHQGRIKEGITRLKERKKNGGDAATRKVTGTKTGKVVQGVCSQTGQMGRGGIKLRREKKRVHKKKKTQRSITFFIPSFIGKGRSALQTRIVTDKNLSQPTSARGMVTEEGEKYRN